MGARVLRPLVETDAGDVSIDVAAELDTQLDGAGVGVRQQGRGGGRVPQTARRLAYTGPFRRDGKRPGEVLRKRITRQIRRATPHNRRRVGRTRRQWGARRQRRGLGGRIIGHCSRHQHGASVT